ncbi:MAG: hypothetical protein Kow00104_02220 [Rhodothalassiaceae bacterium]
MKLPAAFAIPLLHVLSLGAPARAQDFFPGDPEDWKTTLGLGIVARPDFPGASKIEASPAPFFDITYKKRFFLNASRGLGAYLYGDRDGRLKYMLGAGIAPGFDSRSRADLPGMPKVSRTALLRVFGEVFFDRWSIELNLGKDLIGEGHEGMWGTLQLNYTQRVKEFGLLRVGPYVRYGSGDFISSFYDVRPEDSLASGLPVFEASSSFERIGARALVQYPVTRHWHIVTQGAVEHLIDDARMSPVSQDDLQFSIFTGLAYKF